MIDLEAMRKRFERFGEESVRLPVLRLCDEVEQLRAQLAAVSELPQDPLGWLDERCKSEEFVRAYVTEHVAYQLEQLRTAHDLLRGFDCYYMCVQNNTDKGHSELCDNIKAFLEGE